MLLLIILNDFPAYIDIRDVYILRIHAKLKKFSWSYFELCDIINNIIPIILYHL